MFNSASWPDKIQNLVTQLLDFPNFDEPFLLQKKKNSIYPYLPMPICLRFATLPSQNNGRPFPFTALHGVLIPSQSLHLHLFIPSSFQFPYTFCPLSLSLCFLHTHTQTYLALFTMSCCESCKPKTKILAVIFDLDGTLLDTGLQPYFPLNNHISFISHWFLLFVCRESDKGVVERILSKIWERSGHGKGR